MREFEFKAAATPRTQQLLRQRLMCERGEEVGTVRQLQPINSAPLINRRCRFSKPCGPSESSGTTPGPRAAASPRLVGLEFC